MKVKSTVTLTKEYDIDINVESYCQEEIDKAQTLLSEIEHEMLSEHFQIDGWNTTCIVERIN